MLLLNFLIAIILMKVLIVAINQ